MSPLDDLSPDLRAALSLVVDRGKSYAEVADLLGIPEEAVRERAHAALDALAGGPAGAAGGVWAGAGGVSAGASQVSTGAGGGSAEAGGGGSAEAGGEPGGAGGEPFKTGGPRAYARAGAGPPKTNTSSAATPSPAPTARASSGPAAASPGVSSPAVSRRGGAILLGGLVAVIAVVVILVTSSGGSSPHGGGTSGAGGSPGSGASAGTGSTGTTGTSGSTGTTGSTGGTSTTGSSGKGPKVTNQITMRPPESSSKAIGVVEVLAEGSQHAFYIAAEKLEASKGFFYVVWLYDSPSKAEAISKAPSVSSNGRLQGGALLPSNAHEFHKILLTKETDEHATTPGTVALSGAFSLGH
ncbi:MAG TPA: sigma factor-like helix-turn-helix DNA-binding protein [Solirubrobacteraceae bacterium]|nr:sigma factor-like helix-turn-helix DNA-binding protein [Solirubrobacteraceae bacterium]